MIKNTIICGSIVGLLCLNSCSPTTNNTSTIANPWIQYATLHDAGQSGMFYLKNAPQSIDGNTLDYIGILSDGTISEVQYGNGTIIIRKGLKQDSISGDYNDYAVSTTATINEKLVTLKAKTKSGEYNLAEWNEGLKYSCSIYSESGISLDDLKKVINNVF